MRAHGLGVQEESFLLLSGLQHFAFCRRQWAMIHIEGQWAENLRTVEGELLHERCHDAAVHESRGDVLVIRDLRIHSQALGLTGACDVVEFHRDAAGVPLAGRDGTWLPFPVEYKRGKPKAHRADELQLCAQALCLEEMLCCAVAQGALFYGETRRRQQVLFDQELRELVKTMAREMQLYARLGHTPKVKPHKGCALCSLQNLCLPVLCKNKSAARWVAEQIREQEVEDEALTQYLVCDE